MVIRLLFREYFYKEFIYESDIQGDLLVTRIKSVFKNLLEDNQCFIFGKMKNNVIILRFKSNWSLLTSSMIINMDEISENCSFVKIKVANHPYFKYLFIFYSFGSILFSLFSLWLIYNPEGWVINESPYSLALGGAFVFFLGAFFYKMQFLYEFHRSKKLFELYFRK